MDFFESDEFKHRWHQMTLAEQLGNIGSEVERAIRWKQKSKPELFTPAFERSLALFDLSIADPRWRERLKEICRAREVVCDTLVGENEYNTSAEFLQKYFLYFATVARLDRERAQAALQG